MINESVVELPNHFLDSLEYQKEYMKMLVSFWNKVIEEYNKMKDPDLL